MCYSAPRSKLGETVRDRRGGMRECGTPAVKSEPTARHEETNVGRRGGCGARPCRDWPCFSGTDRRRRRLRRRRPAATSACVAGHRRQGGQEIGPGPARGARHRDDHRQRRHQAARRQRDHRGEIRGRRPGQAGRRPVRARQPLDRSRRSNGSRRVIAGAEAQFEQAPTRRPPLHRSGREERHHRRRRSNNAQTQVNVFTRARQFQQGHARRPEGAAQLLHHPRADLRPHQHGERQGRQHRAAGRSRRRSRPSTRSRRSTSPSPWRSAACRTCGRRSRPRPRRSRRSFPAATRAQPARSR